MNPADLPVPVLDPVLAEQLRAAADARIRATIAAAKQRAETRSAARARMQLSRMHGKREAHRLKLARNRHQEAQDGGTTA